MFVSAAVLGFAFVVALSSPEREGLAQAVRLYICRSAAGKGRILLRILTAIVPHPGDAFPGFRRPVLLQRALSAHCVPPAKRSATMPCPVVSSPANWVRTRFIPTILSKTCLPSRFTPLA